MISGQGGDLFPLNINTWTEKVRLGIEVTERASSVFHLIPHRTYPIPIPIPTPTPVVKKFSPKLSLNGSLDRDTSKAFQQFLNDHGRSVTEDGIIGIDTKKAIQNFLNSRGAELWSDGQMGAKSSTALRKWLNRQAEPGESIPETKGEWNDPDVVTLLQKVLNRWAGWDE